MGLRSVRIPPYQVIAAGLLSWWPDDRRGRQGIETVQKQQPIDSSRNVLRKPNPRQPLPRSGGTSGIMKMMKSTNPNMAREPPTRSILLLGCCVVPVGRHFCSRTGLLRQDPWRPIAACQPNPPTALNRSQPPLIMDASAAYQTRGANRERRAMACRVLDRAAFCTVRCTELFVFGQRQRDPKPSAAVTMLDCRLPGCCSFWKPLQGLGLRVGAAFRNVSGKMRD